MKKRMMILAVLLVFATAGLVAFTPPQDEGGGKRGRALRLMFMGVFKKLDLTQDQREDIRAIVKGAIQTNKDLIKDSMQSRKELAEATFAENFDEAAVRNAFRKSAAKQEELAVLKAKVFSEIRPLLTEEQLEILKNLKINRRK
jgi:Spy/CpxP family protein refolding chaperone